MLVLDLKDVGVRGFGVDFVDGHEEELCETCGGFWVEEQFFLTVHYDDDTTFEVQLKGGWSERYQKEIVLNQAIFTNWLLMNLDEIKSMDKITFQLTLENFLEEESIGGLIND